MHVLLTYWILTTYSDVPIVLIPHVADLPAFKNLRSTNRSIVMRSVTAATTETDAGLRADVDALSMRVANLESQLRAVLLATKF